MDDLFKKILFTGVGIVSTTAESLQKSVDEWIDKGNISKDEGRKIIEDFWKEAGEKKDAYEGKVMDFMEKAKSKIDIPTREEIETLNARIAELEEKLATKDNNKS